MQRGCVWLASASLLLAGLAAAGCEGDDNSGGGGGQVTNVSKTNADPASGTTSESGSDSAVTGSEPPAQSGDADRSGASGTSGGGAGPGGSK